MNPDENNPSDAPTRRSEAPAAPGVLPGAALQPGSILKDRYVIERELGHGGIGAVYIARDRQLVSRQVVVKVLLEKVDQDPWFRKKFQLEMEALARIDHPGVVGVLDAGELPDGKPFLVIQFIEGRNLRSMVDRNGADLDRAAEIIRQISHALAAAHAKGIIHRDLKPENIMLQSFTGGEEVAKLIDFGIATVKDSQSATNRETTTVVGSLVYMAPEQLMGKPVYQTDIYALGVIAYELVTGRVPFHTTVAAKLYTMQQAGVQAKPMLLRDELPEAAQEVILRALAFDPKDRFQRASDFGDELYRALKGVTDTAAKQAVGTVTMPAPPPVGSTSRPLEVAHVLSVGIVTFGGLPMEEQLLQQHQLQEIVEGTRQFRLADRDKRLICLPTVDGMALVYFGDPIACVECALEIAGELPKYPKLKLRIGVNTGPVYRAADINANLNVSGGGINTAQRVMEAGDAGHILLSKSTADLLMPLSEWAPNLHDLGERQVDNVPVRFYSLLKDQAGNPAIPARFHREDTLVIRRRRVKWMAISAGLAVALLGAFEASRMISPGVKPRRSVAVMGFQNITARPDDEWYSTALAEGLRTELATTEKLRAISGEDCAEMRKDLGLSGYGTMSRNTLGRIHNLGADLVLVGSYTVLGQDTGERIHLNVEVQDAAAGETVASVPADGKKAELQQLITQTGRSLRLKLGLGQLTPEKEKQTAMSQPSPEAARPYSDGLAKLRDYEPMQARSYLQKAVDLDPAFPFAHSALADAWSILGYDQKAQDEAKKAFDQSEGLGLEDQLSIEGRYRGLAADWPAAISSYNNLYKHFPDNLEYGLKLAEAQRSAGKGNDALATLAAMRKGGDDARIDREAAETSNALGDYKQAQASAAAAAAKAKAKGARLLESRSLYWSCDALRRLGQLDKAKQACQESRNANADLADKVGAARAANGLANILYDQGDMDGAKSLFEQALAIAREIGDQRDISGALNNVAMILTAQGQLDQAKQRYEEALKIQREIDFKSEIPGTLGNIGYVLQQQGDFDGAQQAYEQAIKAGKECGSRDSQATAMAGLGDLLFERGRLDEAEQSYNGAIAIQRGIGAKSHLATTLSSLGDLLLARDKLSESEQRSKEAVSIQDGLGEKGSAAASRAGLVLVFLEKGEAAQAEAAVQSPIQEFRAEKDVDNESKARLLLARALLEQKKVDQARKEIAATEALAAKSSSRTLRLGIQIVAARLGAAAGGRSNADAAIQSLQKAVAEARKTGIPSLELEARLAIGEIEMSDGRGGPARAELAALQKEASSMGFALIARKANR